MDFSDKRVKYIAIGLAVIVAIVGWRIFSNVSRNREKAMKSAQVKAVAVNIGHAQRKTIKPVVKLNGSLEPAWEAEMAPKIAARIRKVYVDVGSVVREGDLLAELDVKELGATAAAAEGSLYDARAALAQAQTHLERYEKLYAEDAVSASELDNARFSRDMAAGKLNSAQGLYENAMSRLEGTKIRAPHDGTIVKRHYQEGHFAKDDKPIFKLADTSELVVRLDIPEGHIGYVDNNTVVTIEIPALDNKRITGRITKLAKVAELPARTFAAEVTVENPENKIPGGLFVNVYLNTKERANVLTLPQKAVVMREDQRTVYVVGEDDRIIRRVLDTGYIGDGLVEVRGGITEKERIVLSGQNRVKEGSLVKDGKEETANNEKAGK